MRRFASGYVTYGVHHPVGPSAVRLDHERCGVLLHVRNQYRHRVAPVPNATEPFSRMLRAYSPCKSRACDTAPASLPS